MKVGDLCSLWSGDGDISLPENWVIGIVIEMQRSKRSFGDREMRCQVAWSDVGEDGVWYRESSLRLTRHPMWESKG